MSKPTALDFSMQGDQYIGTPYSVMDCQAFVERCMLDVGLVYDLPGSNAWYRRMTWVGSPEECKARFGAIPKGAILYILEHDGKEPEQYKRDGIGNASHMGIYIERLSGAINSSKSRGGVAYSEFHGQSIPGGWNRIGLWDQFDYGDKINSILNGGTGGSQSMAENADVAIVHSANGQGVNMRSQKSTGSNRIMTIPEGAEVLVVDNDGIWSSIEYDGKHGYAMSMYLMPVEQETPEHDLPMPDADGGEVVTLTLDKQTALRLYDHLGAALSNEIMHG